MVPKTCAKIAAWGFGILLMTSPAFAAAWDVSCGQEGKAPCAFSPARMEGKQGGLCPVGQFWDPIQGGTCWSCPTGLARTVFSVTTAKACEKVAAQEFKKVIEHKKGTGLLGTDCPAGQFWDIADFKCHSCPAGYSVQLFEEVHSAKKCAKSIPNSFAAATKVGPSCGEGNFWDPRQGGECWSCPQRFVRSIAPVQTEYACEFRMALGGGSGLWGCQDGLSSIRGTCLKTGVCGKENQRPCEAGERTGEGPSCDANLREDFKRNLCVPLRVGETPFTAGVSSLAAYWGSLLETHCLAAFSGIQVEIEGRPGVGARCGRDIFAGFTCALLRDVGAGKTDVLGKLLDVPGDVHALAVQMNEAANASPCKEKAELFAKATLHGKATGDVLKINCPKGQFWDPNGNCYSCPAEYTRTLFPVENPRACSNRIGGNLAQFTCGAAQRVQALFSGPLDCMVEVLEDGAFLMKPLDLGKADQAVCQATGRLGYAIVTAGFETGKAAATGDITGALAAIPGLVTNGADLKRLLQCRRPE